jgi:protocatechuate 3,4-dioxygenase beta subunit
MRRRNLAISAAVAVLAVILAWLFWPSGKDEGSKGQGGTSAAARQRAARKSGTADRRPAGMAGRVVDEKGNPIGGAVVSIAMRNLSRGERSDAGAAPEPLTATTGDDGRWSADNLVPGRYTVAAAARGHIPSMIDPLVLAPAERKTGVDFALRGGGHTLSGTVSDIGGGPIAGALVRATSTGDGNLFHLFRAPFTAVTGPDGTYELTLADSSYMLEAIHVDYVGDTRWSEIRGGDRTEDFVLTPGGVVQGQVRIRGSDEPVAGAVVSQKLGENFDFESGGLSGAVTDGEGRFVLRGLKSGTLELTAFGPGYASREPTEVEVGIAEEVTGVVILVDKAYSITGYVVDKRDKDKGIDGVLVGAYNFNGQVHLARDSTAEDGFFEIHGVQNGTFMIGAAGEERVVALMGQQVTVKDADVTDVIVELDAGITLSGRVDPPNAARIGLDVDPESIGLGTIASAVGAAAATTRAAADGSFALRGVPAGTFSLVAQGDDGSEGRIEVNVTTTDQSGLLVKLDGRAHIAGVVVDAAGHPVEGVQVEAQPDKEPNGILSGMSQLWGHGRGVTHKDGTFEVRGLASGKHTVSVEDRDGRPLHLVGDGGKRTKDTQSRMEVTIDGAKPLTGLRLVVEIRDRTIRGLVIGPNGQPVADAWVTARVGNFTPEWMNRKAEKAKKAEKPKEGEGEKADEDSQTVTVTIGGGGSNVESSGGSGESSKKKSVEDEETERRQQRRWAPAESPVLTGADGRFEIRGLSDTTYDLEVEGLKGTARGLTEDVKPGADVTIRLEPLAGIRGKVTRAGQPVASYMVEAEGPMSRKAVVNDPSGEYHLGRLDPGKYKVSVIAPEGRSSAEVKVAASQTARRDMTLVAYGSVRGVLVDALTGKPMANLPVVAFAEEGDVGALAMSVLTGDGPRTDSEGRFRVGRLGTGDGSLVVFDGDKTAFDIVAQKKFKLAPGQDLDLGTVQGHDSATVPKDQRGDLGMTVSSTTWAERPRASGVEVGEPPSGLDGAGEHLWVASVEEGGPAAAAGVKLGDRIDAIAGVPVSQVGAELAEAMLGPRQLRVGQPVALVVDHDGKKNAISITPRASKE